MPAAARFCELTFIPLIGKPKTRSKLTDTLNVQEVISGLNRFWGRFCLPVVVLLIGLGKAPIPTAQAGEKDDVDALLQLENDMAQAWVQRDAQTLVRTLADDFALSGTGDCLIDKEEYVAGLDNPEFRTTSATVDDLRIHVYSDASVVTGRAVYRGWFKKGGKFVRRLRFTDTFIRNDGAWKCVAKHASGLPPE
jgi:ketosteroid isomerase-like protein